MDKGLGWPEKSEEMMSTPNGDLRAGVTTNGQHPHPYLSTRASVPQSQQLVERRTWRNGHTFPPLRRERRGRKCQLSLTNSFFSKPLNLTRDGMPKTEQRKVRRETFGGVLLPV